jgi:predicted nucleic acid-binding protein
LLSSIDYEIAEPGESRALITDPDDQPILDAAIAADVDILISGDKHFLTLSLNQPTIMSARTYLTTYIEAT